MSETEILARENAGGHSLSELSPGQHVLVQNRHTNPWQSGGVVLRMRPSKWSYDIETPGGIFARNRQFLRPVDGPVDVVRDAVVDVPLPPRRSPRLAKKTVRFSSDTK